MKRNKYDKEEVRFIGKEFDFIKKPQDDVEEEKLNMTESYQVLKESVAELRL